MDFKYRPATPTALYVRFDVTDYAINLVLSPHPSEDEPPMTNISWENAKTTFAMKTGMALQHLEDRIENESPQQRNIFEQYSVHGAMADQQDAGFREALETTLRVISESMSWAEYRLKASEAPDLTQPKVSVYDI